MKLISLFRTKSNKTNTKSRHLVLIGTVKEKKQYDICFSEKFYHIPLSVLVPDILENKSEIYNIKYVAMYKSINFFGNQAGIKSLGIVKNVSIVKRKEITQIPKYSNELYVLFEISDWHLLNEPIKVDEVGVYPAMVIPFGAFKASKSTAELDLKTSEERELFRLIRQLSTDVNMKSFEFGDYTFFDENDNLIVLFKEQCILQLPMEVMRELPKSGFDAVILSMTDVEE